MENERWPAKYHQSVATSLNRTGDSSLNNEHGDSCENICIKEEPDAHSDKKIKEEGCSSTILISEKAKQTIQLILDQIKTLSQNEKFLLYLKLPAVVSDVVDPFRQPLNPLGSRSEISRTICWIRTHLVEDPNVSLPKQEVYNEYEQFCEKNNIKPLSQADFGKVMKQVFPKVRARRLGQRGNSKYCYSGLRRSVSLKPPMLPDLADKPMSTEAPFAQSTAAAWLIIREWSQQQLGMQFASFQALAYYLILNCSVGAGTEAAGKLTSAAESQIKAEDVNGKTTTKHREMQLQLQKKIQQKNENKKRKIQSTRAEPKPGGKKSRSASVPAPSPVMSSPAHASDTSATPTTSSGGSSSNSASPTQGRTICDKSDFTQLPALPDFNSFHKPKAAKAEGICSNGGGQRPETIPACAGGGVGGSATPSPNCNLSKVPIPRLHGATAVHGVDAAPPKASTACKKYKYKTIQPRLQQCDTATYNTSKQVSLDSARSQPPVIEDKDKTERVKLLLLSTSDCDNGDDDVVPEDFPLTRERLNSVSNVEKDAMDEYLGTNNSQHEEELSKYFCNDTTNLPKPPLETTTGTVTSTMSTTDLDHTTKLSTLRQLLEQNGINDSKQQTAVQTILATSLPDVNFSTTTTNNNLLCKSNQITQYNGILPAACLGNNNVISTRRRVSFETQSLDESSSVPPSPNTRRKNFSFTPISPGPHSPNGAHSKCSSTTASPFVSPRNTPIPRAKNTTHQNAGMMLESNIKLEKEHELSNNYNIPTSGTKSMLQKLLDSNTKVLYKPDYAMSQQEIQSQLSAPVNQNNIDKFIFPEPNLDMTVRSQSVPLHQMANFIGELPREGDFSEVDPIPSESDTVKRILNTLDDQEIAQRENNNINMFNIDLTANNHCLPEYGLHLVNNNEFANDVSFSNQIDVINSQTDNVDVDINISYNVKSSVSRSVPNTPLPITIATNLPPVESSGTSGVSSRSYPSTPLTSDEIFTYNSDCLLNGQPIRVSGDNLAAENMVFIPNFDINNDNNKLMVSQEIVEGDFGMMESGESLMDDNCMLMQQNYNANIN